MMNSVDPDVTPGYGKCNDAVLSVKHVLLECSRVRVQRVVLGNELNLEKVLQCSGIKNVTIYERDEHL